MSGEEDMKLKGEYQGRLSAVERDVTHLSDEVGSLKRDMNHGFDSLQKAISNQREAMSNQKTPITQMAGMATVVLMIIGAILWPQIQADAKHEARLDKMGDIVFNHISDGHPRTVLSRVEKNDENLEKLDTSLQREMRLLNDTLRQQIFGLDSRLQNEMKLIGSAEDSSQSERLKALERAVFEGEKP